MESEEGAEKSGKKCSDFISSSKDVQDSDSEALPFFFIYVYIYYIRIIKDVSLYPRGTCV